MAPVPPASLLVSFPETCRQVALQRAPTVAALEESALHGELRLSFGKSGAVSLELPDPGCPFSDPL